MIFLDYLLATLTVGLTNVAAARAELHKGTLTAIRTNIGGSANFSAPTTNVYTAEEDQSMAFLEDCTMLGGIS